MRERIVAAFSRRLVIVVGAEKLVPVLGGRGKLPVEVIPFALPLCRHHFAALALSAQLRQDEATAKPFITDNGNYILDCEVEAIPDPPLLHQQLMAVPGVVGTGLFLDMAHAVLIQRDAEVEVRRRQV